MVERRHAMVATDGAHPAMQIAFVAAQADLIQETVLHQFFPGPEAKRVVPFGVNGASLRAPLEGAHEVRTQRLKPVAELTQVMQRQEKACKGQ